MGDALVRIVGRYLGGKLLFFGWFCVLNSPVLFLMWLFRHREAELYSLGWFTIPWVVLSIVPSWLLGHSMTHYIIDEHELFLGAVKRSWYDLRFKLAFVPVIGGLFTPDEDKTKRDDD